MNVGAEEKRFQDSGIGLRIRRSIFTERKRIQKNVQVNSVKNDGPELLAGLLD